MNSSDPRSGQFATTRWSIVIAAGGPPSPDSRQALESLAQAYWYPLYAYIRRRVPDVNEAQDLTQAFFAELLEKNYVGQAMAERGRFRSFLLTAFKHFLGKEWEKAKAQKRGGGRLPISLNFSSADSSLCIEPPAGLTAEQVYERQWAIALLTRITERLRNEFEDAGKAAQFEQFKGFLIGDPAGSTYAEAAAKLGMTEAAAKKAGSRIRQRYGELLREEIAQTVSRAEEVDDEIRSLFAALTVRTAQK
jgi:DNA-directed RNA polymerase specialized sigma24 family protein